MEAVRRIREEQERHLYNTQEVAIRRGEQIGELNLTIDKDVWSG